MTDLTKGIVEIEGVEISANTVPADILNSLKTSIVNHAVSKNGKVEIFSFKRVKLLCRFFDVDVTFIGQRISDIEFYSYYDKDLSYAGRFKMDCEWLNSVLGEPTQAGSNGILYKYDFVQIGATNWESDGRSGPNEFIRISY